jgi:hypothetical protein
MTSSRTQLKYQAKQYNYQAVAVFQQQPSSTPLVIKNALPFSDKENFSSNLLGKRLVILFQHFTNSFFRSTKEMIPHQEQTS